MKNNLKKNFIWNLVGSTFNSFTSLFFLIIVARINGVDTAGIFTFAFSNACFMQVIGIYVTRVFQVTENNKDIADSDYIYCKLISSFVMLIIVLLFGLIKGYTLLKLCVFVLLVFYKGLDAFSESVYAIMQKNNELYKVGFSLFIKGVIGTIVFLFINIITKNIIISIVALIISNILIIIFYDILKIKKYNFRLNKLNLNKCMLIFKLGFWTFLFTFLTQYLINASKYAIDNYLSNDIQTVYGIISMPATIMILISNFIIHPFLVTINDNVVKKEYKKVNKIFLKMILSLIAIGLAALITAYFLGIPVLNILYGIKLNPYLKELLIIIIGAIIFAITIIISNVLIAMRRTMSQTVIFIITSVFACIISNMLVKNLAIFGAALSYLLSMSLLLILYIVLYVYVMNREIKK